VGTLPVAHPIVYATLGTGFNHTPGIFETIIAAARDAPVELIVTVGRDRDPAALGPLPRNVHVARYIPQSLLFPYCDVVVAHGGWNTTLAALSHGLPLVLIPLGADQPHNAARCAALHVGRVIRPADLTPQALRDAVHDVLNMPTYRRNARRLRAEMDSLPEPAYAVALLEQLARDRAPIVASRLIAA
jgi:MGT family glycosyltransferase